MMSIEARAKILADKHYQVAPVNGWMEFYKTHLRDAVEEAVKEAKENGTVRQLSKEHQTYIELEQLRRLNNETLNRPKVEDALKAVMALANRCAPSHSFYLENISPVVEGIEDILAGRRDSDEARKITGVEKREGEALECPF